MRMTPHPGTDAMHRNGGVACISDRQPTTDACAASNNADTANRRR